MSMHLAMKAALESGAVLLAYLLKIELPGETIRLVDGSGFVVWAGETYTGKDAVFGSIADFGDFNESEGTEAPRQTVRLLPQSNAAIASLTAPAAQGAPVTIYAAVINPATGQVVGAPDVRFAGELDNATLTVDLNERALELELCTVWDRLFDDNEGHRWNDAFWTHLYGSGARAFRHVPNVGEKTHWGFKGPANGSGGVTSGGGGAIGGGGNVRRDLV